jgi:multiple sugar transport system ATP-binding protein
VALGRCLVRNPLVFLFDEPLSNLDAKLRAQMRVEIKRLHAQVPTTSVFVTHDQVEAMTLGDRVVVMRDGKVQQVGTPLAVYARPVNRFVAGFIGAPAMNFIEVTVGPELTVSARDFSLSVTEPVAKALEAHRGRTVMLGMRPEHLVLGEGAAGRTFPAVVEVVEQLGFGDPARGAGFGARASRWRGCRPRRRSPPAIGSACRCRRAGCISSTSRTDEAIAA